MDTETLNQEIFNLCVIHLLKQNKRAQTEEGSCKYRAPDGLKCAIGALISDKDYQPSMEETNIYTLIKLGPSHFPNSPLLKAAIEACMGDPRYHVKPTGSLLIKLQAIHDLDPVDEWFVSLNKLAYDFQLSIEPFFSEELA